MQESFKGFAGMYLVAHIAYDGSAFYGSQIQADKETVNGVLAKVFASFGLFGKILAAGRTDRGVHALCNVVAIPLSYMPSDLAWFQTKLNQKLFPHIQVISLRIAPANFHPRFCAKARHYRYVISAHKPNIFQARYVYFIPIQGVDKIKQATKLFIGRHDFGYFSKASKSPLESMDKTREIFYAKFYPYKDYFIFSFLGNGFLHSQVRLMVFALLQVGAGRITLEQLQDQLELKERYTTQAAPPEGLYLCRIHY